MGGDRRRISLLKTIHLFYKVYIHGLKTNTREKLYRSTAREELLVTLQKSAYKIISKVLRNTFYYIKIVQVPLSGILNLVLLIPIFKRRKHHKFYKPVFYLRFLELNINFKHKVDPHCIKSRCHFSCFKTCIQKFTDSPPPHFFKIMNACLKTKTVDL